MKLPRVIEKQAMTGADDDRLTIIIRITGIDCHDFAESISRRPTAGIQNAK